MRRRGLGQRSLWATVLVYLALAVPIARIWHEATASHRYCAEHHALEEAHGNPAGDDQSGRPSAPPTRGHEHESCPFAPLGGQTALSPVPPAAAPVGAPLELALSLSNISHAGRLIAVLAIAPKTSPPA
jgi:hypothetical protein